MELSTGLAMDDNASQGGMISAVRRATPRSSARQSSLCGQGEFVCVIRDVSATGVSVRTFHQLPTDAAIALELQNGEAYELELVRSEGYEASYKFDAPPKSNG